MITVATVLKSGGIYNVGHVEKLRDMATKYTPEHTFVCLSDVDVPCNRIPLTDGLHGWWSKLELFKLRGPVLFFDLDTIIRGDISQMLHDVDLIQLDIEGYEHQAILGAIETIKNCSPVICLELKGLGERYGFSDADTVAVLEDLGYTIADRFHRDVLFTKR